MAATAEKVQLVEASSLKAVDNAKAFDVIPIYVSQLRAHIDMLGLPDYRQATVRAWVHAADASDCDARLTFSLLNKICGSIPAPVRRQAYGRDQFRRWRQDR